MEEEEEGSEQQLRQQLSSIKIPEPEVSFQNQKSALRLRLQLCPARWGALEAAAAA